MPNILDLIASDQSSNDISDAIKDALYAKSAEKIDTLKPSISANILMNRKMKLKTKLLQNPKRNHKKMARLLLKGEEAALGANTGAANAFSNARSSSVIGNNCVSVFY